jgi:hypothetical protein
MNDFQKLCSVSDVNELLDGRILLVDKPLNWTSFDVVGKLKWILFDPEYAVPQLIVYFVLIIRYFVI